MTIRAVHLDAGAGAVSQNVLTRLPVLGLLYVGISRPSLSRDDCITPANLELSLKQSWP